METTKRKRLTLEELAERVKANLITLEVGNKERRKLIVDIARDVSNAKAICLKENRSWVDWATAEVGLHRTNADNYAVIYEVWKSKLRVRPLLGQSIEESARRARKALQLKRLPTKSELDYGTDDVPDAVERIGNAFRRVLTVGIMKIHVQEGIPALVKMMDADDFAVLDAALRDLSGQVDTIRKELTDARQKPARARELTRLLECVE